MRRFDASGLSVRAFCQREGLKENSLYRWCARLAAQASSAASFIDVGVLGGTGMAANAPGRLDVRLELGAGLILHLVRG